MRAVAVIVALPLQNTVSAFVIPFKPATVANVTAGGATLEQHTQSYFVTNVTVGTPPQLFTVDCNTKLTLGFDIGDGVALMVTERNLILTNSDGICTLAVLPTSTDSFDQGKHIEVGIPFLRGRCTHFDTGLQSLGVADAIQR